LQGSGYFASVQISTVPEEAYADENGKLLLPVHLRIREKAPHRISFGAGASSNTGARVEAVYSTNDLAWQAWKLNTGVRLEERKQTLYADIFLPPAHERYLPSLGMAIEKSDISNLQTDRRAFSIQRAQKRGSVDAKYSLNWEREEKQPWGGDATTNHALVPDAQWTWHRLDSILNPRTGQVMQLKLGVASKAVVSDQNFVRSYVRYQHYLPIGQRDTLGLRAEVGYTAAPSRSGIPEEYLFRAGGTNSVRGYAYQGLGVKDGEAIVGGRYMTTLSAEYTHWLDDSWGMALFVDAGNALDSLADARLKYGVGGGARWRSPAGPIAVDLGWGEESRNPRLHFSLAIPF
jgi:translocation and assembly module TamA